MMSTTISTPDLWRRRWSASSLTDTCRSPVSSSALVRVLLESSGEIKDFINEKYDGAVIPFEDSDDAEAEDTEAADADESADAEADTADEAAEETDAE